jgi:hypothetical protein
VLVLFAGCEKSRDSLQSRLDHHCEGLGKQELDGTTQKPTRAEAFYSNKINTCVQAEVSEDKNSWSYEIRDLTHDFLRGPQWTETDIPLDIQNDSFGGGYVSAEGHWQSTDPDPSQGLFGQIAAKIICQRDQGTCEETDAQMMMGVLQPGTHTYQVSKWTKDGIIADDNDEGACKLGHRLSIDFGAHSIIVTDYPTSTSVTEFCKSFQTASSYALRGGDVMLMSVDDIFSCTTNGVNSAIVSKVQQFHGEIADKNYGLWTDDGEGGPPAAVKTPPHPYTRGTCERLLDKKIEELKGD